MNRLRTEPVGLPCAFTRIRLTELLPFTVHDFTLRAGYIVVDKSDRCISSGLDTRHWRDNGQALECVTRSQMLPPGEIENFTGIDSPYEPPEHPELPIRATTADPAAHATAIVRFLKTNGYV